MESHVLKSKFLRAKSDRMKEIEGWAKQGLKSVDFIRQSGGLTENITEDMMLHEKLLELSKARYKFITNNKFEQKIFLQKQMKKSAAMREALQDIDVDNVLPRWAQEAPAPRANSPDHVAGHKKSQPVMRVNREKPESAPARRRPISPQEVLAKPRTRPVFSATESRGTSDISSEHQNFFQTQPNIPEKTNNPSEAAKSTVTFSEVPPKTAPSLLSSGPRYLPRRGSIRRGSLYKPVSKKKSRFTASTDDRAPLRDKRYIGLTQNLCDVHEVRPGVPEVNVIINMLDALHVSAGKRLTDTRRPKIANKIKEYLLKTGVTV